MSEQMTLTQGKYALIDRGDFYRLKQYSWYALKQGNGSYIAVSNNNGNRLFMHRLVLNAPKDFLVDHINHDTLDNRKANLRLCTKGQNHANAFKHSHRQSKYKGVSKLGGYNRWRARIVVDRVIHHLGYFPSEVEAATAYNNAAKRYFGEFALLNDLRGGESCL